MQKVLILESHEDNKVVVDILSKGTNSQSNDATRIVNGSYLRDKRLVIDDNGPMS